MRRLLVRLGKLYLVEGRAGLRRNSERQLRCFSKNIFDFPKMDFASMKVVELRDYLDSKGLPKSGNKQSLIDRAESYWSHLQRSRVARDKLDSGNTEEQRAPVEQQTASPEANDVQAAAAPPSQVVSGPESPGVGDDKPAEVVPGPDETSAVEIPETSKLEAGCETEQPVAAQSSEDTPSQMEEELTQEVADVGEDSAKSGEKRRRQSLPYPKKRKRISLNTLPKNPLQILNERCPGLKYEVLEQSGTANCPQFKVGVTVDGVEYVGVGSSKKAARHAAAEKVLQFLCPFALPPPPIALMGQPIDFTSDAPLWAEHSFGQDEPLSAEASNGAVAPPLLLQPSFTPDAATLEKARAKALANEPETKHPVMLLNQLCPGLNYEPPELTPAKTFVIKTTINGVEYSGEGRNKKTAKQALAIKALKEQFGVLSRHLPEQLAVSGTDGGDDNGDTVDPGKLPDLMSELVKGKFATLTDNLASPHANHKVLAGVVMTRDMGPEVSEGQVICVATGTKCISGNHITDRGTALNDCHAEVVCRRGLRKYLYDQLLLYARNKEESVFEACDACEAKNPGYKLKSDVFFHLYINTSPCGDSRIFSPHETGKHTDDHPNRKARGLLRTKIEVGEGTIPVLQHDSQLTDGVQPWDSVIGGERLLTMSCSDKIARWNLLGIQGSLLSLYIEPVYFSSIILGSLYHSKHLSRGVYSRVKEAIDAFANQLQLENAESEANTALVVKEPFKVHRPLLASVSAPEARRASKAPSFCFHWTVGDESHTIVNTFTGKGENEITSNLCKKEMYRLFHKVLAEESLVPKVDVSSSAVELPYDEMKKRATDYQLLKENLHAGFRAMGLGAWVKKPAEVDSFLVQE